MAVKSALSIFSRIIDRTSTGKLEEEEDIFLQDSVNSVDSFWPQNVLFLDNKCFISRPCPRDWIVDTWPEAHFHRLCPATRENNVTLGIVTTTTSLSYLSSVRGGERILVVSGGRGGS
jgi:hypothetical protein